MKNKLLAAVLIVALFIPTVIAIVSYNTTDSKSAVPSELAELAELITVWDLDGREHVYKNDTDDGKDVISLFREIFDTAEKINALPDALRSDSFYKVVLSVNDKLEPAYQFYFSADGADSYFETSKGEAHRITSELAQRFLASDLAQSVYEASHAPAMTLSGDISVLPTEGAETKSAWSYLNITGNYADAFFDKAKGVDTYEIEGRPAISFENEPDNLTVRVIASDGSELYNGEYKMIGDLGIEPGDTVTVEVLAKWFRDEEKRSGYGEMNHEFKAVVSAAADFYPGVTKLERGNIVSITAVNVSDPSKISVTCPTDDVIKAVWYKDGEYYRALIALDFNKGDGTYTLEIEYAGNPHTILLDVETVNTTDNPRDFTARAYTVSDDVFNECYSEEALGEAHALFDEIVKTSADVRLWDGGFLAKATDGGKYGTLYGMSLNITGKQKSMFHGGIDFDGDANVLAINSGTVAYVGQTAFNGNLVVIDHGWGLKTWYSHLSKTSVTVGDQVKKGDVIGQTGDTGFTNGTCVFVEMTLWDRNVMPYNTWDNNNDADYTDANGNAVGIPMYGNK